MLELKDSMRAWGTEAFAEILKRELAQQATELPLQQALARSNHVTDAPVTVLINDISDAGEVLRVNVSVLYSGMIAGCSCAGDPTPDSEIAEYCELALEIDKGTAVATITLLEG